MSSHEKWSYSAGERPHTVTVEERRPGGNIYVRVWDPDGEKHVRRSLEHKDKERAKTYAIQQAAKLREGRDDLRHGKVKLARLFTLYGRHRTPQKSDGEQKGDERRAEMWTRFLGAEKDPQDISLREWESFIQARRTGALGPRGKRRAEGERTTVGNRTVERDCDWLKAVFNWAVDWRTTDGHYLMRENPVRGFESPNEKNPERAIISQDRHEIMREVSDRVLMQVTWDGETETRRSYLSELLDIANGTGRRISAICDLRYEDIHWERTEAFPHGAITWRRDADKEGYEWRKIPISAKVRAALDRIRKERPGIGSAPLFPRAKDPSKPITKDEANKWFRRAEKIPAEESGLPPMPKGRTFHGYRAKFATETKHLADRDRAGLGGWKSTETIRRVYDQTDHEGMLKVLEERGELREAQ